MRIERKNERGLALMIALFMVSFLLIMVTANGNALFTLKREIKLVEQRQKAHWDGTTNRTRLPEEKKR